MAALIIPTSTPFGGMTNTTTSRLINLNATLARLADAIATASSGFEGTPGTQFEAAAMGVNGFAQNNFGIVPDQSAPGANGTDYAYAVSQMVSQWETFWPLVEPYISQLDNGAGGL